MAEDKSVGAIQKAIDEANDKLLKSQEAVRKSQEDLAKAQKKANNSDESQELLKNLTEQTAELVQSNKRLEEKTSKTLVKLTENLEEAEGKKADQFASLVGKMREINPKRWNAEMLKEKHKDLVNDKEKLDNQKTLIEEYGGVATANKKWRKAEKQYRLDEFKLQRQSATSRAGRKEIKQEEREYKKKQGNIFEKIAANTSGMLGNMKDKMKTAGKGVLAFLSTLALGGALILLGKFLQSKTWEDIKERLKRIDWEAWGNMLMDILSGLGKLFGSIWTYFMGGVDDYGVNDGEGFFSRFGRVFKAFNEDGIIDGLTEMMENFSILELGIVGILGVLAPLAFIFKRVKGIGKLIMKLTGIGGMFGVAGLFSKDQSKNKLGKEAKLNKQAGAKTGQTYKMKGKEYRYLGQQFVTSSGATVSTGTRDSLRAGLKSGKVTQVRTPSAAWSKSATSAGKYAHLSKFPKLLAAAKGIPLIGPILTGTLAVALLNSNKSKKEKILGIGGLLGGGLGVGGMAILFGLLGSAGFPFVGSFIGGLVGAGLGFWAGEWAGTQVAEFLMGSGSLKNPIKVENIPGLIHVPTPIEEKTSKAKNLPKTSSGKAGIGEGMAFKAKNLPRPIRKRAGYGEGMGFNWENLDLANEKRYFGNAWKSTTPNLWKTTNDESSKLALEQESVNIQYRMKETLDQIAARLSGGDASHYNAINSSVQSQVTYHPGRDMGHGKITATGYRYLEGLGL